MRMKTLRRIAAIGVAFATQACVVREAPPVNAGYYPSRSGRVGVGVATPQPYAVATMPPDPLFEQMTASPGMGHVWIDGSWHWNGYEWVWVSGRWEQDQSEHVYVQPYYDYSGDTYIYTPGYWASRDRLPRGSVVRDHRDGRPSVVAPHPRPSRPPVATPPHDPYRPLPSRHPGGRDIVGPGDAGPITAPRPTYDLNGGGTYRPSRPTNRPPAPTDGGYRPNGGYRPPAPTAPPATYQPPQRDVGGMPSTPMNGGGPVPAGGYGPSPAPIYNPANRGPAPGYAPRNPPTAPPARSVVRLPPARTAPPQGAPARTAPPPPPPARTAPPPPSNATPPRRR